MSDSLCVIILADIAQNCTLLGVHKYSLSTETPQICLLHNIVVFGEISRA